jgi:hypothetical protein
MCGLVQADVTAPSVGHHVSQTVDMNQGAKAPAATADDVAQGENPGLLTICLMLLTPGITIGLWLLLRGRLGGWWTRQGVRRPVLRSDLAVPPPPLWRQATVLRI